VDRLRAQRRLDPLPDEDSAAVVAPDQAPDPGSSKRIAQLRQAIDAAIASLAARDRLRLACYYSRNMTLAAIGRMLREHEATVSRHLTRVRRSIREAAALTLKRDHQLDDRTVEEWFQTIGDDPGIVGLTGVDPGRKNSGPDRSK
jgi:DNA-directed RNA polymerase specialized sigma24 family protein